MHCAYMYTQQTRQITISHNIVGNSLFGFLDFPPYCMCPIHSTNRRIRGRTCRCPGRLFLVLAVALLCGSLSSFTYVPIVVALSLAIVANLVGSGGFLAEESEAKNSGLSRRLGVRSARHSRALDRQAQSRSDVPRRRAPLHVRHVRRRMGSHSRALFEPTPACFPLPVQPELFHVLVLLCRGLLCTIDDRKGPRAFSGTKCGDWACHFWSTHLVGPALNVFVQRVLSDSTDTMASTCLDRLQKGTTSRWSQTYRCPRTCRVQCQRRTRWRPDCWFLLWLLMFHTAYAVVMLGAEDELRGATAAAAASMASVTSCALVKSTPASISG